MNSKGHSDRSKIPDQDIFETVRQKERIPKGPPWYRSQRYTLAFILAGGIMNIFFQRNNLNIAIVCMVNHTHIDSSNLQKSYNLTVSNTAATILSNNVTSTRNSFSEPIPRHATKAHREETVPLNEDGDDNYASSKAKNPLFNSKSTLIHNSEENNNTSQFQAHRENKGRIKSKPDQIFSDRRINLSQNRNKNNVVNSNFKDAYYGESNSDDTKSKNNSSLSILGNRIEHDRCSAVSIDDKHKEQDGPLRWDKQTQGLVLGAIYWTYSAFALPCNALVQNLSKKRVIAVSVSVLTMMSMLIHGAALLSPWAVIAVKLVQGVCTSLSINCMYGFWGQWAPPEERAGLLSLSFAGSILANAIVYPISGLLCKYGFLGGWPSVFYVFGLFGVVWVCVFVTFTADTPASHPSITAEERYYIQTSLSSMTTTTKTLKTPWRSVLTSVPVWAFFIQHLAHGWGFFLIMTTGSLYMREVLKFPVDSNGLYNMIPYVFQYIVANGSGQAINFFLQRKKRFPLIWLRRTYSILGNVVPATLLVFLSFLDCTQSGLAVCLLTIALGLTGVNLNGFFLNPYDIAPQFSQSIMTFSNMLAVANGVLAPYVVTTMTIDQTRTQWQMVFFMTSGIMTFGTIVFCVFGKVDVQAWAMPPSIELDIAAIEGEPLSPKSPLDGMNLSVEKKKNENDREGMDSLSDPLITDTLTPIQTSC